MHHNVYSIHDKDIEEYSLPFFQPTQAHAVRVFKTAVLREDPNNALRTFADSHTLYLIGTYDDESGIITTVVHTPITTARAVLNEQEKQNGRQADQ